MQTNFSRKRPRRRVIYLAGALVGLLAISPASAHFVLDAPVANLMQNPIGDPQKLGPCGGTSADPGTPTGAVTELIGGSTLHLKLRETVFHPGHYRVALARTPGGLPEDPETQTREGPRGPISVSAAIADNPVAPVLADGLFQHTERPAQGSFWEADLTVPNVECHNCVLQVIQWMAEHRYNSDGGYSYHHCATVSITRNPSIPTDRIWALALGG